LGPAHIPDRGAEWHMAPPQSRECGTPGVRPDAPPAPAASPAPRPAGTFMITKEFVPLSVPILRNHGNDPQPTRQVAWTAVGLGQHPSSRYGATPIGSDVGLWPCDGRHDDSPHPTGKEKRDLSDADRLHRRHAEGPRPLRARITLRNDRRRYPAVICRRVPLAPPTSPVRRVGAGMVTGTERVGISVDWLRRRASAGHMCTAC